jgi:hypothetical protein
VRDKDLCDFIVAGEIYRLSCDITAAKDAGFDLKSSREAEMLFYSVSFFGR